jgi:hypothetical protein
VPWNTRITASIIASVVCAAFAIPHGDAPARPAPARPALSTPVYDPVRVNEIFDVPLPPPPACDGGRTEVRDVVRSLSRSLAAKRILYASDDLADCSGMVHRVLKGMNERCDDIIAPTVHAARSARAIAAWYAQRNQLATVLDPVDADEALVPGAIVFFGPPGRKHPGLDDIFHIAMVYSVARDDVGRVDSYRLFQARRPGKVAGITSWHHRDSDPPLGNGNEVLVAVAWPSPDVTPIAVDKFLADAAF